jgi:hypothetical protein
MTAAVFRPGACWSGRLGDAIGGSSSRTARPVKTTGPDSAPRAATARKQVRPVRRRERTARPDGTGCGSMTNSTQERGCTRHIPSRHSARPARPGTWERASDRHAERRCSVAPRLSDGLVNLGISGGVLVVGSRVLSSSRPGAVRAALVSHDPCRGHRMPPTRDPGEPPRQAARHRRQA